MQFKSYILSIILLSLSSARNFIPSGFPNGGDDVNNPTLFELKIRENRTILIIYAFHGVWFGIGFGGTTMATASHSIIISEQYPNPTVEDRAVTGEAPGTVLATGLWTNDIFDTSGVAKNPPEAVKIVLSRDNDVSTICPSCYTFDPNVDVLDMIMAKGASTTSDEIAYGYHGNGNNKKGETVYASPITTNPTEMPTFVPTMEPTTSAPTALLPTTFAPTTANPTTSAPSSTATTTVSPSSAPTTTNINGTVNDPGDTTASSNVTAEMTMEIEETIGTEDVCNDGRMRFSQFEEIGNDEVAYCFDGLDDDGYAKYIAALKGGDATMHYSSNIDAAEGKAGYVIFYEDQVVAYCAGETNPTKCSKKWVALNPNYIFIQDEDMTTSNCECDEVVDGAKSVSLILAIIVCTIGIFS